MSLGKLPSSESRWDLLQEGAVRSTASTGYLLLLSAVDQGWTIRQPVRKYLNPIHPDSPSYHISLENNTGQKRELALPHFYDLEEYLTEEQITIKIRR